MTDTAKQCDEIRTILTRLPLILIVEDSADDAFLLGAAIPVGKAKIIHASSTQKARNFLSTIKVDLILLDLNMPGEDGIALLEWLKTQQDHTPVAVVTGLRLTEMTEKANQFDILTILPKPVTTETIVRLMRQLKLWMT